MLKDRAGLGKPCIVSGIWEEFVAYWIGRLVIRDIVWLSSALNNSVTLDTILKTLSEYYHVNRRCPTKGAFFEY